MDWNGFCSHCGKRGHGPPGTLDQAVRTSRAPTTGSKARERNPRSAYGLQFHGEKVRRRAAHIGGQGPGHEDDCELLGAEKWRGQRLRDQETLAVLPRLGLPREQGRDPLRSGVAHAGCGGEAREGEERGADNNGAFAREIVRAKWSRRARHQGAEHRVRTLDQKLLINRYLVGKDGKTARERLKGKATKMLGIGVAEPSWIHCGRTVFSCVCLPCTASRVARGWRSSFGGIRLRKRGGVQRPGKYKNSWFLVTRTEEFEDHTHENECF